MYTIREYPAPRGFQLLNGPNGNSPVFTDEESMFRWIIDTDGQAEELASDVVKMSFGGGDTGVDSVA